MPEVAFACGCAPIPGQALSTPRGEVQAHLAAADHVFLGRVLSRSDLGVTFDVEASWKGLISRQQILAGDEVLPDGSVVISDCQYSFASDARYVVFAARTPRGLVASSCGLTRRVDQAPALLELLDQLTPRRLVAPVDAQGEAVRTTSPLRIRVVPNRPVMAANDLGFRIVLRNVSDESLLLNGGRVLGNGYHAWTSIGCTVHPTQGRPVALALHWRLGGVGGRVYPLGLAFGPDDTHSIEVTADDYFQASALPEGKMTLQCRFTGRAMDPLEWPTTWTGSAASAPVTIELTAPRSPR